jgi:hypothetical protein
MSRTKGFRAGGATGQTFLPVVKARAEKGSVLETPAGYTAKNSQGFKRFFRPEEKPLAEAYSKT